jgi:hypothetical protein
VLKILLFQEKDVSLCQLKIILNPEEIINEYKGGVGVEALALNIMLVN